MDEPNKNKELDEIDDEIEEDEEVEDDEEVFDQDDDEENEDDDEEEDEDEENIDNTEESEFEDEDNDEQEDDDDAEILNENEDNYDDSDEEENDIVISNDIYKKLLEQNHPMLKENNLFEIKNKTVILREYAPKYECDVTSYVEENDNIIINEEHNNIVIDENHKTLPILTKYEKARILGIRANQINGGARPFVEVDYSKNYDGYYIALQELKERKIPFIIKRPLPSGNCEFWHVRDLEQLH